MKFIAGIDDTDNLESRGTGHRVRMLAQEWESNNLAIVHSISRHQLLFDRRIPYTSHNSSAAIVFESNDFKGICSFSFNYLNYNSAEGSDAGLCIIEENKINKEIIKWGQKAKTDILLFDDAKNIALKHNIYLRGITGDHGGIIGALAAVGLRKQGNDGRILWMRGLRELNKDCSVYDLKTIYNIESIVDAKYKEIENNTIIELHSWIRPIIINNKITLFVENTEQYDTNKRKLASKEFIKSISK